TKQKRGLSFDSPNRASIGLEAVDALSVSLPRVLVRNRMGVRLCRISCSEFFHPHISRPGADLLRRAPAPAAPRFLARRIPNHGLMLVRAFRAHNRFVGRLGAEGRRVMRPGLQDGPETHCRTST